MNLKRTTVKMIKKHIYTIPREWIVVITIQLSTTTLFSAKFEKSLLYDRYTLADNYNYKNIERMFQWEKIAGKLDSLTIFREKYQRFGTLQNYKNINGIPQLVQQPRTDNYNVIFDSLGNQRDQGIPLYNKPDAEFPDHYALDASLVAIIKDTSNFVKIKLPEKSGQWYVTRKYIKEINPFKFNQVIVIDRSNQNITTLERKNTVWLIRSMNPVITGLYQPPFGEETPKGLFVMQNKKQAMIFLKDGTDEMDGYSPFASRISKGAYLHGVPVYLPGKQLIEYSALLGTTPLSHMCVRNATSHAKFIYDWSTSYQTLFMVID